MFSQNGMTVKEFETLTSGKEAVLIDFTAVWCGPCKRQSPILDEVSKEMKLKVVKIDVDKNPEVAKHLRITSLPTLMLYKKAIRIWETEGLTDKESLKLNVDKALKKK